MLARSRYIWEAEFEREVGDRKSSDRMEEKKRNVSEVCCRALI